MAGFPLEIITLLCLPRFVTFGADPNASTASRRHKHSAVLTRESRISPCCWIAAGNLNTERKRKVLKSLRGIEGVAHLSVLKQNGVEQVTCRLARCRSKGVMSKGGIFWSAEGGFALALQQPLPLDPPLA